MPNASNTDRVRDAVGGADYLRAVPSLAVQGPHARTRLAPGRPPRRPPWPASGGAGSVWVASPCMVAGTGYTGEDGLELAVPADGRRDLWAALMAAGIDPAGLGARDTFRLEAGLPLHGHELGPGITPLQAGLGWVVGWGRRATSAGAACSVPSANGGRARRDCGGLVAEGREAPRQGGRSAVRARRAAR